MRHELVAALVLGAMITLSVVVVVQNPHIFASSPEEPEPSGPALRYGDKRNLNAIRYDRLEVELSRLQRERDDLRRQRDDMREVDEIDMDSVTEDLRKNSASIAEIRSQMSRYRPYHTSSSRSSAWQDGRFISVPKTE
ncbi:MAG: hypothetical protein AAGE80_11840 [Pseudomonadota bacterium]